MLIYLLFYLLNPVNHKKFTRRLYRRNLVEEGSFTMKKRISINFGADDRTGSPKPRLEHQAYLDLFQTYLLLDERFPCLPATKQLEEA